MNASAFPAVFAEEVFIPFLFADIKRGTLLAGAPQIQLFIKLIPLPLLP